MEKIRGQGITGGCVQKKGGKLEFHRFQVCGNRPKKTGYAVVEDV